MRPGLRVFSELLLRSFLPHPTFLHNLSATANGEGFFRDVVCDARRRTDIRSLAYPHGSDQRAVAADEHSVFDDGLMFVHPVVVAGDSPSADVHSRADFGVAQVGEMIRL